MYAKSLKLYMQFYKGKVYECESKCCLAIWVQLLELVSTKSVSESIFSFIDFFTSFRD